MSDQLTLEPHVSCSYCGPLTSHKRGDAYLHKCSCPDRTDQFCQAHPHMCDTVTDIRTRAYRLTHHRAGTSQLTELPRQRVRGRLPVSDG